MISTLLGLETATDVSTLALFHQGYWFTRKNEVPKTHSEQMLPLLKSLLEEAKIEIHQVQGVAVGVGPGSFTGIRVAVGLAQAFGFGLELPIWPISTLAALAYKGVEISNEPGMILPIWDARMSAVYWGIYQADKTLGLQAILPDSLSPPEKVLLPENLSDARITVLGSGVKAYEAQLQHVLNLSQCMYIPECYPQARAVVELALKQIAQGIRSTPIQDLVPHYVRNNVAHGS